MINKLIAAVVAFLAGVLVTHCHWYKVNLRLQSTHKRNLNTMFDRTYRDAYRDGHEQGAHDERFAQICKAALQS